MIFSALEQRRGFPTFQGEDWLVGISHTSNGEGLRYRQSSLEKITSRVATIGCDNAKTKWGGFTSQTDPDLLWFPCLSVVSSG